MHRWFTICINSVYSSSRSIRNEALLAIYKRAHGQFIICQRRIDGACTYFNVFIAGHLNASLYSCCLAWTLLYSSTASCDSNNNFQGFSLSPIPPFHIRSLCFSSNTIINHTNIIHYHQHNNNNIIIHSNPQSIQSTTALFSTVEAPRAKKQTYATRFDRLKATYKGPKVRLDPDIEAEVGFSYDAFDTAVAATDYSFNRNDVVKGTVVQYDKGGCIVDIGAKASAFLPLQEAGLALEQGTQIEDVIDVDTERDFEIISEEDENGQLLVSIRRIQYRQAWDKVIEIQSSDEVFEAECVSINRGGAICLVEGLRAFLPGSHLTGRLPDEDLIGQKVPLKFLEVKQEENKLVVPVAMSLRALSRHSNPRSLCRSRRHVGPTLH